MTNNELIEKIKAWCNRNEIQEQSFLYGPQGPIYIRKKHLFEILELLKE